MMVVEIQETGYTEEFVYHLARLCELAGYHVHKSKDGTITISCSDYARSELLKQAIYFGDFEEVE